MSKGILITIKVVVTFFVVMFIALAKEAGIPIIVVNLIGLAIIIAVWKYKPETSQNNDNQQLDKS